MCFEKIIKRLSPKLKGISYNLKRHFCFFNEEDLYQQALVLLMTPGLAFFYGGMVRRKNMLSVLMQCFIIMCVLSLQWVLYGYSLSFAPCEGFWGGFSWIADGLFYGNARQFFVQAQAVLITLVYTFIVTFIIYKLVDLIIGVRVDEKEELMGLDLTQHRERAYTVLE